MRVPVYRGRIQVCVSCSGPLALPTLNVAQLGPSPPLWLACVVSTEEALPGSNMKIASGNTEISEPLK